jgi:uncharacterized protein YecT (DUF1311 family)
MTVQFESRPEKIEDRLDRQERECLDKAVSNMDMKVCLADSLTAWDKELNDVYKQLMKTGSPDFQKALRDSERSWIKSREADFPLIDLVIGNPEHGTIAGLEDLDSKKTVVKDRVRFLRELQDAQGE